MIIRGTPKDKDVGKYIFVDSKTSLNLHENGFFPKYIDENGIYFLKTNELINFMERKK